MTPSDQEAGLTPSSDLTHELPTPTGSSAPSSTRCWCAPSRTPTATASATSSGLSDKLDYLQWLGVDCLWLPPFFTSPLRDGGYDVADYTERAARVRHLDDFARARRRRPRPRHPGHHRLRDEPHERPAPVVPGSRAATPTARTATSTSGPTTTTSTRTPGSSSSTPSRRNWTLDPVRQQYFWHRFFSHQPDLNFDNPAVHDAMLDALRFWLDLGIDGFRLDAVPVPLRAARAPTARTSPRRTSSSAGPQDDRRRVPRPGPARRGQPVARRRRRLLRRLRPGRRRVPHGFHFPVMPRIFMARAAGVALPDLGDPRADAGHPRQLPVGHLPAQPRRADARDGHRRGARLHVGGVRQGPADEGQHRHPPPAGPAARQRPQPDRAVHRAAALPARLAGPLLRRRDRHGRQHLARRPRRRPHPDAVDARPQRRLLHRDPGRLYLPPIMDPVYGYQGQRRGAAREHLVAAALDPADDRERASSTRPSAWARSATSAAATRACSRFLRATSATTPCCASTTSPASRSPSSSTCAGGRAATRSSCSAACAFPRIGELPYLLTLSGHGFYWFRMLARAEDGAAARERGPDRTTSPHVPRCVRRRTWPRRRWFAGKGRRRSRSPHRRHARPGCAERAAAAASSVVTGAATRTASPRPLPLPGWRTSTTSSRDHDARADRPRRPTARTTRGTCCRLRRRLDRQDVRPSVLLDGLRTRRRASGDARARATAFHGVEGAEIPPARTTAPGRRPSSRTPRSSYGEDGDPEALPPGRAGLNPDLEVPRRCSRRAATTSPPLLGWIDGSWPTPRASGPRPPRRCCRRSCARRRDGWDAGLAPASATCCAEARPARRRGRRRLRRRGRTARRCDRGVHARPGRRVRRPARSTPAELADAGRRDEARLDAAARRVPALGDVRRTGCERRTTPWPRSTTPVAACSASTATCTSARCCAPSTGWMFIDFEGEPAKPLEPSGARPDSPLRDVAGMLRSLRLRGPAHAGQDCRPRRAAGATAPRSGQSATGGVPATATRSRRLRPARATQSLLRAYETDKAVYEVVYEARQPSDLAAHPAGRDRALSPQRS